MPIRFAVLPAAVLLVSCSSTVDGPQTVANNNHPRVATESTPTGIEPPAEAPPCNGQMCYSVDGDRVTIYNTPGETSIMSTELNDIPANVVSMKRQLIVYDKDGTTELGSIDIQIESRAVKSVSMKGKPIPRKE